MATNNLPVFSRWFLLLNTLLIVIGVGLLLSYVGLSLTIADAYPYDYGILLSGTQAFCQPELAFEYNSLWLYPAPFYSTMCLPLGLSPPLTLVLWMLIPFFLVLILSGRRGLILLFPPFFIHMLLGQSTWLLLPLFAYAVWIDDKQVRWWHGILGALVVFKPHIGGLALVWLLYHHRRRIGFVLTSIISIILVLIPAFVMLPSWLFDWLGNGRSFKLVSMANIGVIPVNLLGVGVDAENALASAPALSDQLIIYGFGAICAIILLVLLYWRRGTLTWYDWVLVFCLANPLIHDYDLIILIPFIGLFPFRLKLAMLVAIPVWAYAMVTGMYHASILITIVLLMSRLIVVDEATDKIGAVVKW